MTLTIYPFDGRPHWRVAATSDKPLTRPHPESTGYPTWATATTAGILWALEAGHRADTLAVAGRADKAAARELGVRFADARPGRMGAGARQRQRLALLYKNTRDGKVPTFEDFLARLADLGNAG